MRMTDDEAVMAFDDMLAARGEVMDMDTLMMRASGIEHWRHVIGRSPTVFTTSRQAAMDDRCAFDAAGYMEWARSLDYPNTDRPDITACSEIADRMYGACVTMRNVEFRLPLMWASASMYKQGLTDRSAACSVILAGDRRLDDMLVMCHMHDDGMIGEREGRLNVRKSPFAFASVLMAMLENGEALPMTFVTEEVLAMGPTMVRPRHARMLIEPKTGAWNPLRALWLILHSHFLPKETYGDGYYADAVRMMNGSEGRERA